MTSSLPHQTIRLLLVDDHAVMRSGLANMLGSRSEFKIIAEASDGTSGLALHQKHLPDVTLLDIAMPGMSGIECLRLIKTESPDAKVIMLSSSEFEQDIRQTIELGADGYVLKHSAPAELIEAILAVGRGETSISDDAIHLVKKADALAPLTPRELETLDLLRKGMSNPDIGLILGITPRTAKAHVAAILLKLEAHDRAEAVAKGFELGLLRTVLRGGG